MPLLLSEGDYSASSLYRNVKAFPAIYGGYYVAAGAEFFQSDLTGTSDLATMPHSDCAVDDSMKVSCGYDGINEEQCQFNDCCWSPTQDGVPSCFLAPMEGSSDDVWAAKLTEQLLTGSQLGWQSMGGRDNQNPPMGVYDLLMQSPEQVSPPEPAAISSRIWTVQCVLSSFF